MGGTFHGASYFYLVPVAVFLPLILIGLWSFGLKDLFRRTDKEKRARRLEQIRREKDAQRRLDKAGGIAVRPVTEPPRSPLSWAGRALAYGAYAVVLGTFSSSPPYRYWPADMAQMKVSLSVPGVRKHACHRRTRAELAKLPPNMRAPMACSRERHPVVLDVWVDGNALFHKKRAPNGWSRDGASAFYAKFPIAAGRHSVAVRLSLDDGKTVSGKLTHSVTVEGGQVVVVGYDETARALYLR